MPPTNWFPAVRDRLERDVLPRFLPRQRWFAGKARRLAGVDLIDATAPGALPSGTVLALFDCRFDDGGAEPYFLPLLRRDDSPEPTIDERWILDADGEAIADALADGGATAFLLDLIGRGGAVPTSRGAIVGVPTGAFAAVRGPDADPPRPSYRPVEQSNSAVRFGDRLFLKVFRKLVPGINPDFEIGRFLCERTTFAHIPMMAGALEYRREAAEPVTLAILQEWMACDGTGWECALAALGPYFDRAAAVGGPPPPADGDFDILRAATSGEPAPAAAADWLGVELEAAANLGRRTGEMHVALASDPADPDFAPEAIAADDLDGIARDTRDQCATTFEALAAHLDRLRPEDAMAAGAVLDRREALEKRLDALGKLPPDGTKIRVHGDYHLGQTLRTGGDFVLLDFEGEPAKPLDRRRAKQSALKDVVGMLRSFDYAAFGGLFRREGDTPEARERLVPWAIFWRDGVATAFLREYLATTLGAAFVPADRVATGAILAALTLDKAMYELLYELNNRPEWVRIPLRGVAALARADHETGGRP